MRWNDFKALWSISFTCWGLNPYADYDSWERWAVSNQQPIEDVETVDRIIEFYAHDEEWKALQRHSLTKVFIALHGLYYWAELPIRRNIDSALWRIERAKRRKAFKPEFGYIPK